MMVKDYIVCSFRMFCEWNYKDNININVKITKRNRIYLNKKETIKFFNYIKDIKVQKEYEYKFK